MMSDTAEKTVYFVRHGESVGNVSPMFQPPNSALTDAGRAQAARIAERVAKLSFETLIASPLIRAKETAEAIVMTTGKNPEYSDLFVERIKPSRLVGKPSRDDEARKLWDVWKQSLYTPGLRFEDGENFDDLMSRADAALRFLENRVEHTLVVVTHGFFLRTMIMRAIFGEEVTPAAFKKFQARVSTANTGLTVLKFRETNEGKAWHLWIYNDHAHLG
jgi:broad specificity phosphatase PhoE